MISSKECNALCEAPRLVFPYPRDRRVPPDSIYAVGLDTSITPFEDVAVHSWPMGVGTTAWRQVIVSVDQNGRHDGVELLANRDRSRLSQFKKLALVGLTRAPVVGRLTRVIHNAGFANLFTDALGEVKNQMHLGEAQWFDVIDRERGVVVDYDDASHILTRVGKLPWLEAHLRGGFRHIPPHMRKSNGQVKGAEAWVRDMVLGGAPAVESFLIRTISSAPDSTGRPRRFIVRRRDWVDT